jgi:hypothetical protein
MHEQPASQRSQLTPSPAFPGRGNREHSIENLKIWKEQLLKTGRSTSPPAELAKIAVLFSGDFALPPIGKARIFDVA